MVSRRGEGCFTIDRQLGKTLSIHLFPFQFLCACIFHFWLLLLFIFFSPCFSFEFFYCRIDISIIFYQRNLFSCLCWLVEFRFWDMEQLICTYLMSYLKIIFIFTHETTTTWTAFCDSPAKKGEEKFINNLVICVNWAFAKDLGHYNIYRLYLYICMCTR